MRKKRIISILLTVIILMIANLGKTQVDNNSHGVIHHRGVHDSYKFPELPQIIPQKMSADAVVQQNFTITLRDNVILDCAKFYPDSPNPYLPNGYPGVIMCHGYGDRKEALESFASAQASFGYCVYIYSMRGQGFSGGLSNLISIVEAQDLIEFVNYVKHDQSSGLDSSKVMIMGGSQGGIIPYMALCNGLNVKAVISVLSSPQFASSWIENGSIKMTLLWSLGYPPDTVRYAPLVSSFQRWIYSSAADKWDSLAYWLPKDRDFTNKVNQDNIPIQLENAWQDKFFNAYGNVSSIPLLTAPKRYYFGAVRGHGGDFSTAEDTWHENFFNEWFYYWLFDINNGILTRPKFHYAYTSFPQNSGMWSFVHDSSAVWPPNNVSNLKLYFKPNGRLETTPASTSYATLYNTVNNNLTMQTAVNEEFTGTTFNSQFKKASLVFQTSTLASDVKMIGTPQVGVDYQSNASVCQFNYQIYEVSGTTSKLVTRANYTDRKNSVNTRKSYLFNGLSHGHIFKAGNKIKIVITNLDTAPDDTSFMGTNPHVLPVLKNGRSFIYYTNKSYITFPVQSNTLFNPNIIFAENEDDKTTNSTSSNSLKENKVIPTEYSLGQNYPNPFNPSTVINYSIPKDAYVTLKLYDLTGKEVATLVNSEMTPGYYSINLNANAYKLSSGIYFYKLEAGSYSNIKKLTLIK